MKPAHLINVITVIVGLSLVFTAGAFAQEASTAPVQLLIIDETHSIKSSLQVELFARALLGTGGFRIHALTAVPTTHNPGQSYDIAVILPAAVDQVWIVTPDVPSRLLAPLAQAFQTVKTTAARMYESGRAFDARTVVGVTDDLFPAVYSGFLVQNGWL